MRAEDHLPPLKVEDYPEQNRQKFAQLREHEYLLCDHVRVETYHQAIAKYVHAGDTVIDLGTGTGILSFFSAQAGASKIFALDHSEIISAAEQVAKFNQLGNIEFIKAHSSKVTLDTPVDIIVHEQMGNFLLDEHMVENICDLRERLLKKGGRILPASFELFIEPVKIRDSHHIPMLQEMNIHGIDFSCLQQKGAEELYSFIWRNDPTAVDFFLCKPQPIYKVDLQTIKPAQLPAVLSYSRPITHPGRLDGFIVYFKCEFDSDLQFTTGPFTDRAGSWKYWLLRVKSVPFKMGAILNFELKAEQLQNPTTWQWEFS